MPTSLFMPYGLFNYGGTINTMGLSPIAPATPFQLDPDYVKDPSGIEGDYYGSQIVTKAYDDAYDDDESMPPAPYFSFRAGQPQQEQPL